MGAEEAGGGKEACRGREGQDALCAVVSNVSGILRAVEFAVLGSACVMQLRDQSPGLSTCVLEQEQPGLRCG